MFCGFGVLGLGLRHLGTEDLKTQPVVSGFSFVILRDGLVMACGEDIGQRSQVNQFRFVAARWGSNCLAFHLFRRLKVGARPQALNKLCTLSAR